MKKLLNKKGFTLIELIVVIAILAILALILVPSILNYIGEANRSKDQANARSEYSRVSLLIATEADVEDPSGTAITSGVDYTIGTGTNVLTCNVTWTGREVTDFYCESTDYTFGVGSDFVPSAN